MRLIDADALINYIDVGHLRSPVEICLSEKDFETIIKNAPTIVPATNWTPCSEGLPEDEDYFSPMGRYECTIQLPDGTRETFHLHRGGNGRWFYETGKAVEEIGAEHVVAWRHVSNPY